MPDILSDPCSRANDASVPTSATADTDSRACKRSRPSPPHQVDLPPQSAGLDKMDIVIQPTNTLRDEDEASHASSDWGDWADAQVAQSSSPKRAEASFGERTPGEQGGPPSAEEDAWIRSMMDQGTDRSVVQGSDSRAWDYVLQMAVESEAQGVNDGQLPCRGEWNAAEVRGATATEFVSRWLHRCLPISLPALRAFGLVTDDAHRKDVGYKQPGRSSPAGGWVVVDKLADPSSVAIVSRSAEQAMHRITLLSLNANAGAALAADVVQPGAAGLVARGTRDASAPPNHFGGRETDPGHGGSHRGVGVVFESLDSRILEVALMSAMGRLGLSVTERTRSGLWRLPPGATLTTPDASTMNAFVTPLTEKDASFIARSVSGITPDGAVFWPDGTSTAEAAVRGLIHRNPSVGVRRNGHLVAWCLSFDNGLAGAIHVTEAEVLDAGCTATEVVALLLQPLLSGTGASQTPAPCQGVCRNPSKVALASSTSGEGKQDASIGGAFGLASTNTVGEMEGCALAGVVVDEAWPFVPLLGKIGLERVCDADWVRFEPNSSASCREIAGGVAPLPAVMFGW